MLKCAIIPSAGREISGILPNNKRISEETILCLNKREILKCMKNGSVYGIREDGTRVLLTDSETINREIMGKVKERQSHEQEPELLDSLGLTEPQKQDIKQNVNQYRSDYKHNKNQRNKK